MLCCASSLSPIPLFSTPWTIAHQASLFMGIFQARVIGRWRSRRTRLWGSYSLGSSSRPVSQFNFFLCQTLFPDSFHRYQFSSVQFSRSVMSYSLRPQEPQHTRPPYPSPTPGVYPNPCPSSWWCHPTISSSVVPFSSCPQTFPASGSFQMSQFFSSGGQSIGVSASTSVRCS